MDLLFLAGWKAVGKKRDEDAWYREKSTGLGRLVLVALLIAAGIALVEGAASRMTHDADPHAHATQTGR